MRAITSVFGETRWSVVVRHAALWLLTCFAALSNAAADSNSQRFLFIVDTSAGMKKLDESLRQTLFDLIYSGVRGCMTNGDTYGVWLVNEVNDTSLPMEVWKKQFAVEIAARPTLQVKERGYRGSSRLDLALADAARVAKNVGDVTVIVISNGETSFRGTPFDSEINAAMTRILPEMQEARAPINTALVARDGKWVAWAVNSPHYLVQIPEVPRESNPPPAEVAVAPAASPNQSATTSGKMSASVAVAKPTSASTPQLPPTAPAPTTVGPKATAGPIIITRETVAYDRAMMKALASTQITNDPLVASLIPDSGAVPAEPALSTNAKPAVAPTSKIKPAAPPAEEEASSTTTAISQTPIPPPAETVLPPPAEDATAVSQVETLPMEADDTALPSAAIESSAPVDASGMNVERTPLLWVAAGASCATVVLLVIAMRRDRRDDVSLISQAAAMERLQRPRS